MKNLVLSALLVLVVGTLATLPPMKGGKEYAAMAADAPSPPAYEVSAGMVTVPSSFIARPRPRPDDFREAVLHNRCWVTLEVVEAGTKTYVGFCLDEYGSRY